MLLAKLSRTLQFAQAYLRTETTVAAARVTCSPRCQGPRAALQSNAGVFLGRGEQNLTMAGQQLLLTLFPRTR